MEDSFIPFEKNPDSEIQKRNLNHNHVLKNNQVQLSSPIKIVHQSDPSEPVCNPGKIEPLYNNGTISGVRYYCHCGNIAEIIFEYDADNSIQNQSISK